MMIFHKMDTHIQFSSVAQSCLTLCNPMDYSIPGYCVLHYLPGFAQIHVHWVGDAISSSAAIFFCLQPFPASGSFPMSQFFASGGKSTGASSLASVLPMNIQGWFPLGWTGWISLLSQGLSRVFSDTTALKHQFFGTQASLGSSSHICLYMTTGKTVTFDYTDLCRQGDVFAF